MTSDVSTPKKPGRKAETPAEKARRLHREWKLAEQTARERHERTLARLAAAIVAEAIEQPEFMASVREIAKRRTTSKAVLTQVITMLDEAHSKPEKIAA